MCDFLFLFLLGRCPPHQLNQFPSLGSALLLAQKRENGGGQGGGAAATGYGAMAAGAGSGAGANGAGMAIGGGGGSLTGKEFRGPKSKKYLHKQRALEEEAPEVVALRRRCWKICKVRVDK
jgi:hypothetical protein